MAVAVLTAAAVVLAGGCHEPPEAVQRLFEDVAASTGFRYGAKDSTGAGLDGLKIVERDTGGYLGVYHTLRNGAFEVRLATSENLLDWTYAATLAPNADMPALAQVPGEAGFLLAHEQWMSPGGGECRIAVRHYASEDALRAGRCDRVFLAPKTLSTLEGTPSIDAIDVAADMLTLGFHYYDHERGVDRAAEGRLTGFLRGDKPLWKTNERGAYERKLVRRGVRGNIGDRDGGMLRGRRYELQEGQLEKGEWASWRMWLYDAGRRRFHPLDVRTHGGSTSFGNGTFTVLRAPSGRPAVVVTYFLFAEGAAEGEAGELIFYTECDE